jgi:hypothetical protein
MGVIGSRGNLTQGLQRSPGTVEHAALRLGWGSADSGGRRLPGLKFVGTTQTFSSLAKPSFPWIPQPEVCDGLLR